MQNNNNSKRRGIIAVFGPEGAGKRSILNCIDPDIPKDASPYEPDPLEYCLKDSRYVDLEKFIFRNYTEFIQIKRDYPIKFGLLVFNIEHVLEFKRPDAFLQYSHFLEFLQKFVWLNVSHYIMAITRLDLVSNEDMSSVYQDINRLKDILERVFSITIEHCIPLSLNSNGKYQKLFGDNNDVLTRKYEQAFLPALNSMASKIITRRCSNTWIIGRLEKEQYRNGVIWKTGHKARGEIEEKNKIIIHQTQINGSIDRSHHFIPNSTADEKACKEVTSLNTNKMILVPYDSTAKTAVTMDVHVLLRSGISHSDLKEKNRSFFFLFFGHQGTEGDIDRCIPSKSLDYSSDSNGNFGLIESDKYALHHHLGQEVHLKIHCRNADIVVDLWENDSDSGSLLIWDDRGNENVKLIGIGRIKGFPDSLIKDCIEKLMLFDKYRKRRDSDVRLLSYQFHNVYHTFKNLVANKAQVFSHAFINQTKEKFNQDFDLIVEETKSIQSQIGIGALPNRLLALYPHLIQLKQKLSEQYDQIDFHLKDNNSIQLLNKFLVTLKNEHTRNVELIRKHTVFPIWSCVSDARRYLGNDIKTKVDIHNQIPKNLAYYPEDPQVLDNVYEAVCQLFDNSRTHAVCKDDIQIDIFIDPPNILNPNCVRVYYQDNGIFTKEVSDLIEKGEGALRLLMREFELEDDGVKFSSGSEIGMATSFVIDIPVWSLKTKRPELIAYDLLEIFNAIDYETLEKGETFQNYLEQFGKLLLSLHNKSSFSALNTLIGQAADCTSEYKKLCLYMDEIVKTSKLPVNRYELDQLIEMTHKLQFYPIIDIFSAILSKKINEGINFAEDINIFKNETPCHRVRSYKIYDAICDALKYFLVENFNKISIEMKYIKEKSGDSIMLCLDIPKIGNIQHTLLPLITRLHNLGVETSHKNNLSIFIPIQTIRPEGEIK